MAYGSTDTTSFYFKDPTSGEIDYTDRVLTYNITKRINNLWTAELTLIDIDSTERGYIKEGNTVKIFSNTTLLLRGIMDRVEYDSYNGATVSVVGMSAQMKESNTNNTYTNTATSTVVTDLASGTGMVVGTNDNYGLVTVRFDNENNLKGIHDLAETVDYYWDESWGAGSPYETDTINFASAIGTAGAYTFNASGASANMNIGKKLVNTDKQVNYVITLGYGDGINQLKSEIFDSTSIRSTLGSALGPGSPVMYVDDTSDFGAAGSVWVGQELIGYTGKGTGSLTGLGSELSFMGNVVESYTHDAGAPVYEGSQYSESFAQSGTSIDDYGVIKARFTDKRIVDQNALDIFSAKILADKKNPVEMITLEPSEQRDVLDNMVLGDTVTVTDTMADLSGTYTVVGIIFGFNLERGEYLEIEISNKKDTFLDTISKLEQDTERVNIYMQGATNIITLSEKENCDNAKPLNMRFYIPDEAVAINSAKINFTTQKFRAYTSSSQTSTDAGGATTVKTYNEEGESYEASGAKGTWHTIDTIGEILTTDSGAGLHNPVSYSFPDIGGPNEDVPVNFRIRESGAASGYSYFPEASGIKTYYYRGTYYWDQVNIFVPQVVTGYKYSLQTEVQALGSVFEGNFVWTPYSTGFHSHDLTMDFGVHEQDFSASGVTVTAGAEGAETAVDNSPYSVGNGSICSGDITDEIRDVGAGNWFNVKFTPDDEMRIEANANIQMFLKSS